MITGKINSAVMCQVEGERIQQLKCQLSISAFEQRRNRSSFWMLTLQLQRTAELQLKKCYVWLVTIFAVTLKTLDSNY